MLQNALHELRDEIEANDFDSGIAAEIARDNGVRLELLLRKFAESFGVAPEQYREHKEACAAALALHEKAKRAEVEKARRRALGGTLIPTASPSHSMVRRIPTTSFR